VAVSLLLDAVWAHAELLVSNKDFGWSCSMPHCTLLARILCYAWSCFCEAGMLWSGFHL